MQDSINILPLEISIPITKEKTNLNDSTSSTTAFPKSISSLHLLATTFPSMTFNIKYHGNLLLTGFFNSNNPNYPYIVIGPDYCYFIFALIVFMGYTFLFYYFMWRRANIYINIICVLLSLLHHLTYFIVFIKNPGVMLSKPNLNNDNTDNEEVNNNANGNNNNNGHETPVCEYCGCIASTYRRQKHCETCNACFIGYDHHCPWTSKCIAGNNKTMFNILLLMTLLLFILPVFVILSIKTGL